MNKRGQFQAVSLIVLIFVVLIVVVSIGVLALSTLNGTLSGNTTTAANVTNETLQLGAEMANGFFDGWGGLIVALVFLAVIIFGFAALKTWNGR